MRTRSNRAYSDLSWQNISFNIPTLMRQAPFSSTSQTNPASQMSSDSETSPPASPPPPPRHTPARRTSGTSLFRRDSRRSDLVVRNLAILGVVLTISLLFVHLVLYVAIFVIGILAPAWQTFKCLETGDQPVVIELDDERETLVSEPREIRNWQAYWIIAAMILAVDGLVVSPFAGRILPGPLYHSVVFGLVTWLTRNSAGNAAAVYDGYVKPAFQRSEAAIDGAVETVVGQIDSVTQQAILSMNDAVTPYVRHLEHAAASASRQIRDQEHAQNRAGRHRRRGHR